MFDGTGEAGQFICIHDDKETESKPSMEVLLEW